MSPSYSTKSEVHKIQLHELQGYFCEVYEKTGPKFRVERKQRPTVQSTPAQALVDVELSGSHCPQWLHHPQKEPWPRGRHCCNLKNRDWAQAHFTGVIQGNAGETTR